LQQFGKVVPEMTCSASNGTLYRTILYRRLFLTGIKYCRHTYTSDMM